MKTPWPAPVHRQGNGATSFFTRPQGFGRPTKNGRRCLNLDGVHCGQPSHDDPGVVTMGGRMLDLDAEGAFRHDHQARE